MKPIYEVVIVGREHENDNTYKYNFLVDAEKHYRELVKSHPKSYIFLNSKFEERLYTHDKDNKILGDLDLTDVEIKALIKTIEEQSFITENQIQKERLKIIEQKMKAKYSKQKSEYLMKGEQCTN